MDAHMRALNPKLAALTLALMMVFGAGQSLRAEGAAADTASAGTPITFEDAVQIALKQNITLAQAQNAVASDAASVRGAKLNFLPNLQLSTSGSQTYGRNFSETTGDVLNRNNQSLNAASRPASRCSMDSRTWQRCTRPRRTRMRASST